MSFIVSDFNQQNQRNPFYEFSPTNMNFSESMTRRTDDDKNKPVSYTDLPPYHSPHLPDWSINKFQNPYFMTNNPQMYQLPSAGYQIYNNTNTISTPSYCSTFSEASHSSPTLFWAHPTSTNETENSSLFTEATSTQILPENTSASDIYENSQFEISDLESHRLNKKITYTTIGSLLPSKDSPYNKAHARFKTVNTCTSYDQIPRKKITQQLFSPPLLSTLSTHSENSNTRFTESSKPLCNPSFQFQAILYSPTASMKKENQKPITYLNRGQNYLLNISSNNRERGTFTSTISIEFHESNHRRISEGYWKFWLSQQLEPQKARAIDIDKLQTNGIYNVRYSAFNTITFDWHGPIGPKIYLHFHCLSTDFSRIKGVKGIPMRAVVETTVKYSTLPKNSLDFSGIFVKKENNNIYMAPSSHYEYIEKCFCQIKLFRDKGAERKNKDDAKQLHKQLQKITAITMGNPQQHPSWLILNQPYKPLTVLSEVPLIKEEEPFDIFEQEARLAELYSPRVTEKSYSEEPNKKRKQTADLVSPLVYDTPPAKRFSPSNLEFFISSKHTFSNVVSERISLESKTTENLKIKLSKALSLHPSQISELLWKNGKTESLIDDFSIEKNIIEGETVIVELKFMEDGFIRLILELKHSIT